MRFAVSLIAIVIPVSAHAVEPIRTAPFDAPAVSDPTLASSYAKGPLTQGVLRRASEDDAVSFQRQTGSLAGTIKDLWLIDVASPLIGENVRAAR